MSQTTSSLSKLQELLPQLFESTQLPGDRYLRFQLTSQISALFSMESIQESLWVAAEQITPLPNMSGSVMGLMSSRDRVFCVIDLAQLVGMPPLSTYARQHHIVVVRLSSSEQELFLGIAVNQIQGITRVMPDGVQSLPEDFPPSLTPYLRGCVIEQEEQLLILDTGAIALSPHLYQ